jgi:sirohydrochlorin ferrochelatase
VRLVGVAHGTRDVAGNRVAALLTAAAGSSLGIPSVTSYVELSEPRFADLIAGCDEPTVVVPLLLSTGYHVRHDLPSAVARASGAVRVAPPLGPDALLAAARVDRLLEAGAQVGQPVVLVAAGSADPAAADDLARAADLLASRWSAPVRRASLAGLGPRVGDVVRPGDAVSPYLLAPGHFATLAFSLAFAAGAAVVADPIGCHPLVVDLVMARARALLTPVVAGGCVPAARLQ